MSAAQTEKRDLAKGSTKGQSEKTGKIFALTGGILFVIGSRSRQSLCGDGTRRTLRIRRLRCEECRKIHHELPDFLVPYKRYTANVVEAVVESLITEQNS